MKERPDYEPVGPSDQPGKYYVLASPPGKDRVGLYLYDIEKEQFGEPVIENPTLRPERPRTCRATASASSAIATLHTCSVCSFSDPKIESHMKGVAQVLRGIRQRLYLGNLGGRQGHPAVRRRPARSTWLLFLRGRQEEHRDHRRGAESAERHGTCRASTVITYLARDGKELSGYLTAPAGSDPQGKLPLVLMPHGGPEARDTLEFDPWVQYLVARGYAVFQPNFRGSDGFGRKFAESGYGEWGRKMQDDLTDAREVARQSGHGGSGARVHRRRFVRRLRRARGRRAHARRVQVRGVDCRHLRSRGFHRLAQAQLRLRIRRVTPTGSRPSATPTRTKQRLREVSPLSQVDKIKIPMLLIHGDQTTS